MINMTLIKKLCKNSIQGIGIACFIYILAGIIFDSLNQGFSMEQGAFTRQALGTILIGIGFSAPSEIYNNDKLPFAIKILFHMGIGCSIYLITAFYVGWIPPELGLRNCIIIILCQLLIAFFIWFRFASYYRKLAKDMNEKIQQKEAENKNID